MASSIRNPIDALPASGAAPRIWAVGGGKGGVGKSVVTSNLAAALAASGRRCAVIDGDLGGANLHTLLGVSRPRHTLSQLLTGEVRELAELLVQTSIPNLWLVSGNGALLEMANPRARHKKKLLAQVRGLELDDVVLDLGAGSAHHVLDFFLLARRGLVVVTPEPTAIENAEHFLRAALHRSLREETRRPEVRAALARLREEGSARRVRSAGELIALVRAIDPPAAKPLEERARAFAPLLLVNQVQAPEQRRVGPELVRSCRERLGVSLTLAGQIDADPNVAAAVARRQPVLQAFPLSRFARQIEALADGLGRWQEPVDPPPSPAGPPERAGEATPRTERRFTRPALPPFDPAAPGDSLRRFREALGFTLREMIERTRIRNLDDIECERFDRLPPEVYLKGNLMEYARELGVSDVAGLAQSYLVRRPRAAASAAPTPRAAPQPVSSRRRFRRFRAY